MDRSETLELVDLHNHLVPGVDDGARTTAESISCLRTFADAGVRRMAVSPHLDARLVHDSDAFYQRLDRLETAFNTLETDLAEEEGLPELVFSQEILVPDPTTAELVFLEPRVGVRGTRYALIEFGFDLPTNPAAVVRAVCDAGRRPIVAHPERYRRNTMPVGIEEILSWREAGALLQVNGGSLLGNYGPEIAALGWELLARGSARLVATDHHGASWPVPPADVRRKLESRGAGELVPLLFSENPRRVLDDRETLPVPPHQTRSRES
jgi:protein-tyrosine phosphatase